MKLLKYGIPFLTLVIGGSFGLREFTQLRYQFSKKSTVQPNELEKMGIKMKKPGEVTLESEYEKIKKLDIDNWENKQTPVCKYKLDDDGLYTCFLEDGAVLDDTTQIIGDHAPSEGKNDNDVVHLYANDAVTEKLLSLAFTKFKNLKIIEFGFGIFQKLEQEIFANCEKLEKFKLSLSTPLRNVPANTFSNCSSLTELDLSNNSISQLNRDSFTGLSNLKTLILKNNQLLTITRDIFDGLTNLEILDISGNGNLNTFESDGVFKNNQNLKELSIANNKFELLKKEYFEGLTKLTKLDARNTGVNRTEEAIFDKLSGLKIALFKSNPCIDKDFENFQSSDKKSEATCAYYLDEKRFYTCDLSNATVLNRQEDIIISGRHVPSANKDTDVYRLNAKSNCIIQHIPPVIFTKFPNLI
ncbi:hypothetical protein PVAND_005055 [Polypedilum vanderplanki]|uniref:Cytochrome c oxidase assembly protein COX16 homolog, mitochondrial n=1 Tax=Polypedilum vanderplanki TaxID=319348 RepID=A0A9J6C0W3_POLVA|nr:hypothetical protein PVAND_005055 [Polypedilum vanderplanki]